MKYRKKEEIQVLYDLSGRRQEEIVQYQGFLEVADRVGWRVVTVSDGFESQARHLTGRGLIHAVVGNFISETWLRGIPEEMLRVHMGLNPLGPETPAVCWDLRSIGNILREHLEYAERWVFHPQGQPRLLEGLGAGEQFRTQEALREALVGAENVAVVSPTDYHARVAYGVARSAGCRIPEQVGVAGVGNRGLDTVLADVGITSVALPYREKGRRVGEMLLEQAAGGGARIDRLPPIRVMPRRSTRRDPETVRLQERVDGWILSALRDPPPVSEWARRAGMSRRGFERAFHVETGATPYEYLLRLREAEAKRLLRDTEWTLARIGAEIGIPDPPRFSAFFKKRTGTSARKWRVDCDRGTDSISTGDMES